ncbi:MAG: aminopeptidase [Candidatus Undinarchaeales archaeon]|jgi:leucyl aminopeptidase (aminopeptidase T)|nr:aminopeptidase [Candidatus Undinarchaeales archaeon]MDP7494303.1 aminopeptidase [Candidatus Undinarchaeales archaeon]
MGSDEEESDILDAVRALLDVNLGVREGESVLVVTDELVPGVGADRSAELVRDIAARRELAKEVARCAKVVLGPGRVSFLAYPAPRSHGSEPSAEAVRAMAAADVVIAITTFSITHTRGREEACDAGTRVASMPRFERGMFEPGGAMSADYRAVGERSERLAEALESAKEIRITAPAGTDLVMSVEGREFLLDTGSITAPGEMGNLPGGEVFCAPVEGTARGRLVIPVGWHEGLDGPLTLVIADGLVKEVDGTGHAVDEIRSLLGVGSVCLDPAKAAARRNIAELGIGTNPNAHRPDNVLESEKILGTVHVAFGDNSHFGGSVEADLHQDLVIPEPTIDVDGRIIMEQGRLQLER